MEPEDSYLYCHILNYYGILKVESNKIKIGSTGARWVSIIHSVSYSSTEIRLFFIKGSVVRTIDITFIRKKISFAAAALIEEYERTSKSSRAPLGVSHQLRNQQFPRAL
jgi:hypothetical protein